MNDFHFRKGDPSKIIESIDKAIEDGEKRLEMIKESKQKKISIKWDELRSSGPVKKRYYDGSGNYTRSTYKEVK